MKLRDHHWRCTMSSHHWQCTIERSGNNTACGRSIFKSIWHWFLIRFWIRIHHQPRSRDALKVRGMGARRAIDQ